MTLVLSEKSRAVQAMFDKISPRYDFLNRLLSARQDVRWRKALIQALPEKTRAGEGVLYDVACGTGDVMIMAMQRRADYGSFQGFDISQGMMDAGSERSDLRACVEARLKKSQTCDVGFTLASAEHLPVAESSADALSIAFGFRNVDDRGKALREFYRVLKPGGRLLLLEFFPAESGLLAFVFDFYFKRILPFVGGLVSDRASYEYLPRSVSTMPSGNTFALQLVEAGFLPPQETKWLSGGTRLFVAEKPAAAASK